MSDKLKNHEKQVHQIVLITKLQNLDVAKMKVFKLQYSHHSYFNKIIDKKIWKKASLHNHLSLLFCINVKLMK